MAIKYDIYETPNPKGKQQQPDLHARIVNKDIVTTDDIAKKIGFSTSMTEGDVVGVLHSLSYHMIDELSEGKRVHIKGLGYFYITASSPSVKSRNKMRGDMIKVKTVKFLPEKAMKAQLQSVSFKRSGKTNHSQTHTAEDIENKLTVYLSANNYITRAEFQTLCDLTKTMALNWLKKFIEEKKIRKGGNPGSPVYELVK